MSGRALLREARSRFYRKLFVGFVASAVVPVVVLAFATRTYLANQFRAGVEDSAVKTATVAQRLVEDYAALQQRGANSLQSVDDQFMVLVRWAIDQDVHLFDRARLQATSERDLFASHLLPSRTPSNVYRRIVLDRLPTTVSVEDVAGRPYLLAAAPVRTGGQQGHRDGSAAVARAGDRAAGGRARSTRALGLGAVRAARRRLRLLDGRADRRSGQPSDTRDPAHRTWRPRRTHRDQLVG